MNIITKLHKKLSHYTWDLAYTTYENSFFTEGVDWKNVRYVKNPYKDKWFADPFLLDNTPTYLQLFVEEFDSHIKRGRIARITINKSTGEIEDCHIILDLPTHLSFPATYRVEGRIYVHPENSESGGSFIYEYDREKDQLVNPQLMIMQPVTDAVIKKEDNQYCMYATCVPNPNGTVLKKYVSGHFIGGYSESGELFFPANSARMAGHFLPYGEKMIRPAQCCKDDYGQSVILYYGNQQLMTITPKLLKYSGMHTINVLGDIMILDLKIYDYPMTHGIMSFIKKMWYEKQ